MSKAKTTLTFLVGLLSILGVVFTISFLIRGGANEGFTEYPTVTNLHVIPGLIYLALAPLQFLSPIRNRFRTYHRWSGRLLATIGLMLGAAALFISLIFPYSGITEQIIVSGFALFFLLAIIKGVQSARVRHYREHREWMLRAFSIGLSIVTMRLIFIPILVAIGDPTREEAELYSIVSFTLAFCIHSLLAELWIRHTRSVTRIQSGNRVTSHREGEVAHSVLPS